MYLTCVYDYELYWFYGYRVYIFIILFFSLFFSILFLLVFCVCLLWQINVFIKWRTAKLHQQHHVH